MRPVVMSSAWWQVPGTARGARFPPHLPAHNVISFLSSRESCSRSACVSPIKSSHANPPARLIWPELIASFIPPSLSLSLPSLPLFLSWQVPFFSTSGKICLLAQKQVSKHAKMSESNINTLSLHALSASARTGPEKPPFGCSATITSHVCKLFNAFCEINVKVGFKEVYF